MNYLKNKKDDAKVKTIKQSVVFFIGKKTR